MAKIKFEEKATGNECTGWKWKYGCFEEKFDPNNLMCRECEQDAEENNMKSIKFDLELKGPPGSGKSTFINFIMKVCAKSKGWSTRRTEPHALTITNHKLTIDATNEAFDDHVGAAVRDLKKDI